MKIYKGNTGLFSTVADPEPLRTAPPSAADTPISTRDSSSRDSTRRTAGTPQSLGSNQSGGHSSREDMARSRLQRGNGSAYNQTRRMNNTRRTSNAGASSGGGIEAGGGVLGGNVGGFDLSSLAGLAGLGGIGGLGKLGNIAGVGKIGDILGSRGFGSLLGKLNLSGFETEDIILALILYLLYRESKDEEFLIILAAMLFL